jgi:hypothetical protein
VGRSPSLTGDRKTAGSLSKKFLLQASNSTTQLFVFPCVLDPDMASHDAAPGPADLLVEGEGDRSQVEAKDDAALLVSDGTRATRKYKTVD